MDQEDEQLEQLNLAENKIITDYNNFVSGVRISALDPDFIFMLAMIAIPFDVVLAILAAFDLLFGISWVIGMVVSLFPFAIIGLWDYSRTSNIARSHSDAKAKLDNGLEQIKAQRQKTMTAKNLKKRTAAKKSQEATRQVTKQTAKQTAKQTTRITTSKIGTKIVLRRGLVALIGTSVPLIIGMVPWYSIWVLATLKEK